VSAANCIHYSWLLHQPGGVAFGQGGPGCSDSPTESGRSLGVTSVRVCLSTAAGGICLHGPARFTHRAYLFSQMLESTACIGER
jgi:hypothetical protein